MKTKASTETKTVESDFIASLAEAAKSAGIEFSARDGAAWIAAAAAAAADSDDFDVRGSDGIGGFGLALLDFDPASATRLRAIGDLIQTRKRPYVRSALAIAGSAAQGRIQPFPADNDFFERWLIVADTLAEAKVVLASHLREDVLALLDCPGLLLDDVCFGSISGRPLRWSVAALQAGSIEVEDRDGTTGTIDWIDAAADPGFTKIAWMLIDPALGGPGMVSKVVDATWQDADGTVVSLDGLIDGEFQQVYLDATSAELAAEVTRSLSPSARVGYIADLEAQVATYSQGSPPNYGKVAKRLYNICRLTRRFNEALFLRELFDEPPARLIQIETRLWVAQRRAEFDIAGALSDFKNAIADCSGLVEIAIHPDETAFTSPAELVAAITQASAAIAADASLEFERRLRSYEPIVTLLDEIATRYPSDA